MLAIEETNYCRYVIMRSRVHRVMLCCERSRMVSRLVPDLSGFDQPNPIKIFAENQRAIDSGKNQAINQRNKHIDIQYHHVRDVVALSKVEFVHCPTEAMLADPLTKPLDRGKFQKLVKAIGLTSRSS